MKFMTAMAGRALMLAAGIVLCAGQPVSAAPKLEDLSPELQKAMEKDVSFEFLDAPLPKVLDFFQRETGVNFVIDPKVRSEVSGRVVDLKLSKISAADALAMIAAVSEIDWEEVKGAVWVSTEEQMIRRRTVTRIYDIRSLLTVVQHHLAPSFDLNDALSNTNSGGSGVYQSGTGSNVFGGDSDSGSTETPYTRTELIEEIKSIVRDTIGEPEHWAALGGNLLAVREIRGQLIVKATPELHEQIKTLLTDIEAGTTQMVAIEGHYFATDSATIDALVTKTKHGVLSEAEVAQVIRELTDGEAQRIGTARLICFNDQRVHVYAGQDRAFLSDTQGVPDALSPDITLSMQRNGTGLDVMPTVGLDGATITLAIRSDVVTAASAVSSAVPHAGKAAVALPVTTVGDVTGSTAEKDPMSISGTTVSSGKAVIGADAPGGVIPIDKPEQSHVALKTNVRLKSGGGVLLSGGSRFVEDGQEVVLLLRARVID